IGPAWGSFAFAAKGAGYQVSVIERDERCRAFLRDVVGVKVLAASETLPHDLGEYDVVALWHVVEHLPRLRETLVELAAKLQPQGILVIATPNPCAWQMGLMRSFWPHVDAPRHLQLIPRSALNDIMDTLGLRSIFATCNDEGGRSWNAFGWQRLVINALPPSRICSLVGLALGWSLSIAAAPIERRGFRGAAYTAVFRKSGD
ncbi:MAG: class I SAM-dependent methyltransferase, partial [Chloroflexota bacterium]